MGADRTTKKYTFKASANWVAQSDKPEWCKILTSSGDKGSDRQLNISVEANETGSTRSANITVQVSGYARAAQFAITQLGSSSGGTGADTELNKQVDKILEYTTCGTANTSRCRATSRWITSVPATIS